MTVWFDEIEFERHGERQGDIVCLSVCLSVTSVSLSVADSSHISLSATYISVDHAQLTSVSGLCVVAASTQIPLVCMSVYRTGSLPETSLTQDPARLSVGRSVCLSVCLPHRQPHSGLTQAVSLPRSRSSVCLSVYSTGILLAEWPPAPLP